jgi:hypothetical protein
MSQDLRDVDPRFGIGMGILSLAAGVVIILIALDWIHVPPSSIHAPRWVLAICGGVFAVPGVAMLYYGIVNGFGGEARPPGAMSQDGFTVVGWLVGLVVMCGVTTVASWIAFGPGERTFTGGIGVGGVGVGGRSSGTGGRVVFGIGAVLTGVLTIWGFIYGVRRLSGGQSGSSRSAEPRQRGRRGE